MKITSQEGNKNGLGDVFEQGGLLFNSLSFVWFKFFIMRIYLNINVITEA